MVLNNSGVVALSGTGPRTLTLAGINTSGDTLAAVLGDSGGPTAITKNGAGTWILTGNSTNSGTVTINQGTLQVGAGGSGSLGSGNVTDQGALVFNLAGTVTNGVISGSGSVAVNGTGTVVLPGDSTYSGGTTIGSGATLQLGVGGATGRLRENGVITNDGLIIFNTTGLFPYSGSINGSGNVIVRGVGNKIAATGFNTYTGWTLIEPGATYQPVNGLSGAFPPSSVITNNGAIEMPLQGGNANNTVVGPIVGTGSLTVDAATANANGTLTIASASTYTGGTYIRQSTITVGDTNVSGSIVGDVVFTNSAYGYEAVPRFLRFARADDITFAGNITGPGGTLAGGNVANSGRVAHDGAGVLTLTGTNTYLGGTDIVNFGTLRVGNGGTRGSIGSGPVNNNGILVWNRSDSVTFGGVISGAGSFVQQGPGTLTLTATNTYTGSTTVSNGTLVLTGGSVAGELYVEGGTFVPASLSTGGQLDLAGNMTIDSGTVLVPLNNSLSVTNFVPVGGILRNGGSLVVTNVGPALAVNDKFYIFSGPVSGFPAVTGAGATWQNDLAVDGSITALTVPPVINPNPPVIQLSVSGSTLTLGWPTNLGWTLLTNSVGLSATNQWFPYPGSTSATNVSITVDATKTNTFFKMVKP